MNAFPPSATFAQLTPDQVNQMVENLNSSLDALVMYGLSGSDANNINLSAIDLSYFTFDVLEYIGWMQIFKPRGRFNNDNPLNDLRFLYEMSQEEKPTRAQITKLRGVLRDQVYSNFRAWWRDCNAKHYNKVNSTFFTVGENDPNRVEVRKYLNGYDPDYTGTFANQWI